MDAPVTFRRSTSSARGVSLGTADGHHNAAGDNDDDDDDAFSFGLNSSVSTMDLELHQNNTSISASEFVSAAGEGEEEYQLNETANGAALRRIVSQLMTCSPPPKKQTKRFALSVENETRRSASSEFTLKSSASPSLSRMVLHPRGCSPQAKPAAGAGATSSPAPSRSAADDLQAAIISASAACYSSSSDDDNDDDGNSQGRPSAARDMNSSTATLGRDVSPLPNLFDGASPARPFLASLQTNAAATAQVPTTSAAHAEAAPSSASQSIADDASQLHRESSILVKNAIRRIATAETKHLYSSGASLMSGSSSSSFTGTKRFTSGNLLSNSNNKNNNIAGCAGPRRRQLDSSPGGQSGSEDGETTATTTTKNGEAWLSSSFAPVVESSEERESSSESFDDEAGVMRRHANDNTLRQRDPTASSRRNQKTNRFQRRDTMPVAVAATTSTTSTTDAAANPNMLFALQLFEAEENTARTLMEARAESCFETLYETVFFSYSAVFMHAIAKQAGCRAPPPQPKPQSVASDILLLQRQQYECRIRDLIDVELAARNAISESCFSEFSTLAKCFDMMMMMMTMPVSSSAASETAASSCTTTTTTKTSVFKAKLFERLLLDKNSFFYENNVHPPSDSASSSEERCESGCSSTENSRPSTVRHNVVSSALINKGAEEERRGDNLPSAGNEYNTNLKPEPPLLAKTPTIGQQQSFRRWKY